MAFFDVIRGFSVVSMVLFHLCYDLRYIYGFNLPFFQPPLQDIWRASISWTFLLVAGNMCAFSRNGLMRALRYLAVALAVFVVTTVVSVDTPISFGIIFCMGASTLIDHCLCMLGIPPKGWALSAAFFVLFLLTLGVPQGYVGLGTLKMQLSPALYSTPYFSWLGLPGPTFVSGDYYPVIPFTLLYLSGAAMGRQFAATGYPRWFHTVSCKPLEVIGQHALPIYVLHQPIMVGILSLITM